MTFEGQVAIVTGAGSERGIGSKTAELLAAQGCAVVAADLNEEGVQKTAERIALLGGRAIGVGVNVASEESVQNLVETTLRTYGRIDILINSAAIGQKKTFADMELADWNKIIAIDLNSVYLTCHHVLPYMLQRQYGRIVNISSISAHTGGGIMSGSHYCAAKNGVIGLSKGIAREVAKAGITVNCVSPGASKTDINGIRFEDKNVPADIPMGRRGEREEIAAGIVFLSSPEASYITGVNLDINGGAYMA